MHRIVFIAALVLASAARATQPSPGGDAVAEQAQDQYVEIIDESSQVYESYGDSHAESAPSSGAMSGEGKTPCGDASGLSAQTGLAGGGLATITETCRAYRLQRLQASKPDAISTKLAAITHYAGWFPRLLLHVASCGVLN
jgi:hypothetical protein